MNIPTVHPRCLKKGDTIAIVAPAGPLKDTDALHASIAAIEGMGFRVRYDKRIFQSSRYLAGSDIDRSEELMRAFEDDSTQAIIGLRGGYGCARLIPYLKKERLQNHPKLFTGFSDLTTLHLFFGRHFGWITIHGPMAANPGLGSYAPEQISHLASLWSDPGYRPVLTFSQLEAWNPGKAEGRLVGGGLSNVISGIGTPYEIDTEGAILFLEDVGELPYRLDRMFTQLRLAGKLQSPSGIILGRFHECEPPDSAYAVKDVLREILRPYRIPVLANFPAGHGPDNWAIPLGARVRINTDTLSVEFPEPAVR
jgi:muramoyltetrapeptide carboxypeptidase